MWNAATGIPHYHQDGYLIFGNVEISESSQLAHYGSGNVGDQQEHHGQLVHYGTDNGNDENYQVPMDQLAHYGTDDEENHQRQMGQLAHYGTNEERPVRQLAHYGTDDVEEHKLRRPQPAHYGTDESEDQRVSRLLQWSLQLKGDETPPAVAGEFQWQPAEAQAKACGLPRRRAEPDGPARPGRNSAAGPPNCSGA
jgi:hypothetical protein